LPQLAFVMPALILFASVFDELLQDEMHIIITQKNIPQIDFFTDSIF